MANWKTPRPLENRLEVDRRKHPNQLYALHVAQLNIFVERIRDSKYGDMSVPWFDPAGAGVNARVLMLLQDPSKIAEGKKKKEQVLYPLTILIEQQIIRLILEIKPTYFQVNYFIGILCLGQ